MHFFTTLRLAQTGIERSVRLFKNLLDMNIDKVLGVKLGEAAWNITVAEPSHPDITFARSFDFHLDMLWFIIPMFTFEEGI